MQRTKNILLALISVIITAGVVWYANRPSATRVVTWENILTEAQEGGYQIIATEEIWKLHQETPEMVLLVDTRQEWEYRVGHMKGARNFPIEPTWWSKWFKRRALKAFLGPNKERMIVFY
jgi:hypothetical protein